MNTDLKNNEFKVKFKIVILWIYIFFNFILRGLHEFGRPGFIHELEVGIVNGVKITEVLMLVGGLMIQVPLIMLPLTLFLKSKFNQLANLLVALIMIPLTIFSYSRPDLDDMFFLIFEIFTLVIIIILESFKWSKSN